ncbi:hypothetical protein BST97_07615 [Nonlabens spongiae]|uniref:Lipoprotein n=1 Tax=Nonlabens spongiae TaxID=331648 RepID=A0A1W6MK82_9FLAO|nr:DUF6146 family protein [Nonlabens spongiae]ARN77879.1 hypothetical protein BST97_07615 [Nonlabens spongiae]
MKNVFYTLGLLFIVIACSSQRDSSNQKKKTAYQVQNDTIRIANDSLEYEIIIIEPGFYSWLATQPPRGFYSQSTLEIRNQFRVREYNLRVRNPISYDPDLYIFSIDYENGIDYGYEVNYLLYNWFLFFEQRYNQKLL